MKDNQIPYEQLTLEKLEETIREYFDSLTDKDRHVKILTKQGGYDLFCKAMKEQFEKDYGAVAEGLGSDL